MTRTDETWFRLLQWTQGQAPSERLSAQVLARVGFENIDPSHPLGGKDGGRDATCSKGGRPWIMAVYFPRGQKSFSDVKEKFESDLAGALKHGPDGLAFVTNQELRLGERDDLVELGDKAGVAIDLFHLERVAHILDEPSMAQVRKQYLDIDPGPLPISVELDIIGSARRFVGGQDVLHWWLEHAAENERERHSRSRQRTEQDPVMALRLQWMQPGPAATPLTDDEIEERIDRWARRVRRMWPESEDHLAATAWPGLRFRLHNAGEVFLNDVQVIITIDGVRGLKWLRPDRFEQATLFQPIIQAAKNPYVVDPAFNDTLRPRDYPVTWENLNGGVEVTVDLKHLRPHPDWTSNDYDVVLVFEGADDATEVAARWTVTAQGYGKAYEGEALVIPVEPVEFADSFRMVSAADDRDDE